jgi:signal transduction histidine kinase
MPLAAASDAAIRASDSASAGSKLAASASGTGRWLPWVILGICGLALLAIGLLLHRLLGATAECAETNVHLARANNELRRSNSDLEQFSYVSSHDLSTPLRSVAGMSQLLATKYRGQLDEEADKYIGFMEEGVNRMQRIIDDLLEYSRVDSRDLEPAPVNLEQLVDELLRDLAPVIAERHAEVTRDPVPTIQGDRGQLGQVLQNLLVNALTFTAPGTAPKVHVSAQRDGTAWRVSVADNGIGVDPEHRERIFKMFQRLNRDTDYPGTGIGLAITKKMVERHGGDVTVEPGPDGGSVFSFTLPIEPTPARQAVSA